MKFASSLLCSLLFAVAALGASNVRLAHEGEALLPVYVPADAPDYTLESAQELVSYLSKITGGAFKMVRERPPAGIIFASEAEFPVAPSQKQRGEWDEGYRLLTHGGSLYLTGDGKYSVQHAVYRLLQHCGYRQFFPGKVWEVVPVKPTLELELDEVREPAFVWRDLFYAIRRKPERLIGPTALQESDALLKEWKKKNLMDSSFRLHSGHNVYALIQRHRAAFRKHPEWLTTLEMSAQGKNYEPKLLVQHDDLVQLVCDDAVAWLRENPEMGSYSAEPSDRGGWPKESPIGSPSDQTVYLANAIARRLAKEGINRKVAFFAYNRHSPPPSLKLEPGIVVSVTTDFIRGVPVRRLLMEWKEKGGEMGVRDYASVWFRDFSLPENPYMAANPRRLLKTIKEYHQLGVRYYGTEASPGGWASYGLGIYAAMHAFWDPTVDYNAIYADFLDKSFLKAAPGMKMFFNKIDGGTGPIVSEGYNAELYRLLEQAAQMETDEAVRMRISQLIAYVRYIELMDATRKSEGDERVTAFEKLAEFVIRCRTFPTVPVSEVFGRIGFTIPLWDKLEPIGARILEAPEPIWTPEELFALGRERLREMEPLPFNPVVYSREVEVIAASEEFEREIAAPYRFSRRQVLHWLARQPGEVLKLTIKNVETQDKTQAVYVTMTLQDDPEGVPVATETVAKNEDSVTILELKAMDAGLHDIEIRDAAGVSEVTWPRGTALSVPCSTNTPSAIDGPYDAWFYVPPGVAKIGGYAEGMTGAIIDRNGKEHFSFSVEMKNGYFQCDIEPGDVGRFFRLRKAQGRILLMTVPPYLARSPLELLLPVDASAH